MYQRLQKSQKSRTALWWFLGIQVVIGLIYWYNISKTGNKILILYSIAQPTDYAHKFNFEFFLQHGVLKDHPVYDYVIIIKDQDVTFNIPSGKNIKILKHSEIADDFDSWALGIEHHFGKPPSYSSLANYKYFFFISSASRGPFLPKYADFSKWPEYFITLFTTPKVKMVGATISCEGAPHVQPYFFVTDFEGLKTGVKIGVFETSLTKPNIEMVNKEMVYSSALLAKGFNINSMMAKYRDIDWSQPEVSACNSFMNPTVGKQYEGNTLHPFETIFVPSTAQDTSSSFLINRYSSFLEQEFDIITNEGYSSYQEKIAQIQQEISTFCSQNPALPPHPATPHPPGKGYPPTPPNQPNPKQLISCTNLKQKLEIFLQFHNDT